MRYFPSRDKGGECTIKRRVCRLSGTGLFGYGTAEGKLSPERDVEFSGRKPPHGDVPRDGDQS